MTILNHDLIWGGLDNLADNKRISVSRMAILSDVDSTTFNKSKRTDTYGRLRWPSTETLVKVFNAMDITWAEFENFFPKPDKCAPTPAPNHRPRNVPTSKSKSKSK